MHEQLALGPRCAGLAGAWLLLFLASPGVVSEDGSALLAIAGIAWWGSVIVRPAARRPRLSFLLEWLVAGCGCAGWMWWAWYVFPLSLLWIGLGKGLYVALGGVLLRRLAVRMPLPLAIALAWTGAETLRTVLAPPFGLGWMRLGHCAHHHLWLSGSARVWGVEGLSLVLAALGGLGAALFFERRARVVSLAAGAAPLALGVLLAAFTSAPAMTDGPRLLLVQPGFTQERKQHDDAATNFRRSRELTFRALAEVAERGEEAPDLVCWGESMLYVPLFEPALRDAIAAGLATPPWYPVTFDEARLRKWEAWENDWVRAGLFGIGERSSQPRLPAGTSLLAGAETFDVEGGELRRRNAVFLYDARGQRSPPAAKQWLVPGAETMLGLERFELVRDTIFSIAAYVPDFAAAEETRVLALATRAGPTYRFGATVCFDNAFFEPYGEPLVAGPLDFHVVASNEAWYEDSCEMDQMLAFSRILALATGRSLVRATNSGLSLVLGPDGREVGRVRGADGSDRQTAGTAVITVPVPERGAESAERAPIPPYVSLRTAWRTLLVALLALSFLPLRRGSGNPDPPTG